jgi:hypothetical protein
VPHPSRAGGSSVASTITSVLERWHPVKIPRSQEIDDLEWIPSRRSNSSTMQMLRAKTQIDAISDVPD